jgi:hypothetical protein
MTTGMVVWAFLGYRWRMVIGVSDMLKQWWYVFIEDFEIYSIKIIWTPNPFQSLCIPTKDMQVKQGFKCP